MKRTVIILGCLVALLSGCKEVVHFNIDERAYVLVLNSILHADSDSIRIDLTRTKFPDESTKWPAFPDAEVQIYEDGNLIGRAEWSDRGYFLYPYRVLPGHIYRITAQTDGYPKVWGETTVPEFLQECKIELQHKETDQQRFYLANYRWQDKPGKRNFYWFGAQYSSGSPELPYPMEDTVNLDNVSFFVSKSTLPDPFNRVFVGGSDPEYEYYIRVEDSGLDGKSLNLFYRFNSMPAMKARVYILNTDTHYDAYLKSVMENYENSVSLDDFPLIYHPAYVHTNIQGGTGLVGSYTSAEQILNIPLKNENTDFYPPSARLE